MISSKEEFKKILKSNNFFLTRERIQLFQELENKETPCSISEIVSFTSGSMDESTVYRNLEIFEELHIINRVYTGWKYKIELSDTFKSHHHHMTCSNCNKVIPFEESVLFIKELKMIEQEHNFKSDAHSLELKGLCNSCS